MKILIVGDEELSLPYQFFTPEEFPGIDLILSSGDIEPEHLSFLAEKFKKPLFYVKGNHDTAYTFRSPEGCRNIDAQIVVFRGIRILGLEGSIWYGGKGIEYTEKQMRRKIRRLGFLIWFKRGVDIVLTHSPPKGIHEGEDPCHQGFQSFQELILKYKPLYFIHGHVGCSGYGKKRRVDLMDKTKVINSCGYYILEMNFKEWRKKKIVSKKKEITP